MTDTIFNTIMEEIVKSGLSKRDFATKNGIPYSWLIRNTRVDRDIVRLDTKTISILNEKFGIPVSDMINANKEILEKRKLDKKLKGE